MGDIIQYATIYHNFCFYINVRIQWIKDNGFEDKLESMEEFRLIQTTSDQYVYFY